MFTLARLGIVRHCTVVLCTSSVTMITWVELTAVKQHDIITNKLCTSTLMLRITALAVSLALVGSDNRRYCGMFFHWLKNTHWVPTSWCCQSPRAQKFGLYFYPWQKMPLPSYQTNQEALWLRGFRLVPLQPSDRNPQRRSKPCRFLSHR